MWPQLVNRKGYFIALGAYQETPAVAALQIDLELNRMVTAHRLDGSADRAAIGHIMAAKRGSKNYTGTAQWQRAAKRELAQELGGRGSGGDYRSAWRKTVRDEARRLYGGRKATVGFLRAGFISIVYGLAPFVGYSRPSFSSGDTKVRGSVKGTVIHLATSDDLNVVIENRAHSRTETAGGFERIGGAALQRAFDREDASMVKHMGEAMQPGFDKFNRSQK